MIILTSLLGVASIFSLTLNCYLIIQLKKNPKRPQSVELREFLGDLLSGPAIVAVGRIDPSDILMRSPKQK